MLTARPYQGANLRINFACAHFVFKTKLACQLRLSSDAEQHIILTTVSPIKSHSKKKQSMQKYCRFLKFRLKEFDTKLLNNLGKMLEKAALEI